tara:strand:- start:147 stop:893 length:747 start_codon:yes stop_codon:yes gene_type:complete
MANVGNLFVNISGNTKGLIKSLGKAKRSIQGFNQETYTMSAKTARHAAGMFDALGVKRAGQSAEGDLKGAKQTQKMQALYKPGAEQHERYTQAKARMVTAATLGVLGLTVAGVSIMASKALEQISTAKEGAERFRYLGPQGAAIIKAEIDTKLENIRAAQDPDVSQSFLNRAQARLSAVKKATTSGGTAFSITADEYFERMGEALVSGIAGLATRPFDYLRFMMTPGPGGNPFIRDPGPAPTAGAAPP